MSSNKVRLNKLIAEHGICSRRYADSLIDRGKVKVNGKKVRLGTKVDPTKDEIEVKGKKLKKSFIQERRHYLLNKPAGVVTTVTDPSNRPTVVGLMKSAGVSERVFPVGRLDIESQGLLIMTNDGDLAYKLTHPKFHVPKTYHVKAKGKLSQPSLKRLRTGVPLLDGKTKAADVDVIEKHDGEISLEITIEEGRNRQVRRMCKAVNLDVISLERVKIGDLSLDDLPPGRFRELSKDEVRALLGK